MDIDIEKRWSVYSPKDQTEDGEKPSANAFHRSVKPPSFTNIFHQAQLPNHPHSSDLYDNYQRNPAPPTLSNTNPFEQKDTPRYSAHYSRDQEDIYIDNNNPQYVDPRIRPLEQAGSFRYPDHYDQGAVGPSEYISGNTNENEDISRYGYDEGAAGYSGYLNGKAKEKNSRYPDGYDQGAVGYLTGNRYGQEANPILDYSMQLRDLNLNQHGQADNGDYNAPIESRFNHNSGLSGSYVEKELSQGDTEDFDMDDEIDLSKTVDKIRQKAIPISAKINEFKISLSSLAELSKSKETRRRNVSMLTKLRNTVDGMELWKRSLKDIEFNFGSGIKGYFVFIKWLLKLNLLSFLIMFLLVILPMILNGREETRCDPDNDFSDCCTEIYFNSSYEDNHIFDFVQGTGFMEKTLLFQGFYSNRIFEYKLNNKTMYYNLPLAYILVNFFIFLIYFVLNVHNASKIFQGDANVQFLRYCNLVFNNWNFGINNLHLAKKKFKDIEKEVKIIFEFEWKEESRRQMVWENKRKIIAFRILANLIVLAILIASAVGIFYAFNFSNSKVIGEETRNLTEINKFINMFYEFLPSLSITLLNIVVPIIFSIIVNLEKYSQEYAVRMTLIRMIFLRMFSLCILYASMYSRVSCEVPEGQCVNKDCGTICWETFVGQQFYKLVITEFGVLLIMTFIVNFARSRIGRFDNKLAKMFGEQTFDLPKHVLDVVYFQTVCWFGSYYVPFLSGMFTIIFFLMFYIKKFTCVVNCKPSSYYIPQSKAMFMIVLLVSFLFAFIPLALSIAEITPSLSCGPFRGTSNVWNIVTDAVLDSPGWVGSLFDFLTAIPFHLIAFVVLCIILYYYFSIISTNNSMIRNLKIQIKQTELSNKELIQKTFKHAINK